MAAIVEPRRALVVNPLRLSQSLGSVLAFLGLDRSMPLLHGSQGCTAFAKALMVRHFREPIPLQTTALTELSAVLGGGDNLLAALATITDKHRPDVIGVLGTALTEAQGDDVVGTLKAYDGSVPAIYVSTPDFTGGLEDGYAAAVTRIVEELVPDGARDSSRAPGQVNVLVGPALGPLDVEEVREMVEAFGLHPLVLPDLSRSLDGHLADGWSPLTTGGTRVADVRLMGRSELTLAVGAGMAPAARVLEERCRVPFVLYERLTGLEAVDRFVADLRALSGRPVPDRLHRWRRRLADGMLDAHFELGGRRVALALESELLHAIGCFLAEVGAEIVTAVAPTRSPLLERLPCREVVVGDYEDLEVGARASGADLLVAGSHGRQSASRLGIPLLRLGFPVFDRLGAQYRMTAGYRGSLAMLFDTANLLLDREGAP